MEEVTVAGGPAPAGPPDAGAWPPGFSIGQGIDGEQVLDQLSLVAHAKGAPSPSRPSLGRLIQALADRDHVGESVSFRHHCLIGGGHSEPVADVVRAYRAWLS